MKKLMPLFLVALLLIVALTACGGSETSEVAETSSFTASEEAVIAAVEEQLIEELDEQLQIEQTEPVEEPEAEESAERDLPEGDYAECGEGTAYISTAGGTSEDGNVPVIYADDAMLVQIGINAWDFNGGALSHIYVDGILLDKMQLANTQATLNLEGVHLAEGKHVVEVVQYENDDTTANMTVYRKMCYEVKPS